MSPSSQSNKDKSELKNKRKTGDEIVREMYALKSVQSGMNLLLRIPDLKSLPLSSFNTTQP